MPRRKGALAIRMPRAQGAPAQDGRGDMRHGGEIVAEWLLEAGVKRLFSVPGESFLALLDGLHDSPIANVVCRHEGAAAMMAAAHARLTGRPGVVVVTRGPGAANAAAGLHVAMQDSLPVIALIGQVARDERDRESFQEIDYRRFLSPLVKWVGEVDDPARLPEYLSRVWHLARAGRPGPVALALPEDVLSAPAPATRLLAPAALPEAATASEEAAAVAERLDHAARPLVILGGSLWSEAAAAAMARLAEARALPVAAAFRRQDMFDNRHPAYAGDLGVGMNPALGARLAEADLLLVLGARLDAPTTGGWRRLDPARAHPPLVHVHPDPDLPGRNFRPELALARPPEALLSALAGVAAPAPTDGRRAWQAALRVDYEAWSRPARPSPGAVRLEDVVLWLSDNLPEDAILTNGAGNYAAFLHRYFRYRRPGTQLAPTSGSMGFALPAAIAASLARPGATVVCFTGDGDLQMTVAEFATAAAEGARPIVIVANNGQYGTIRMHQELHYPGRVSGTALGNPDFVALARAHGGHGERVEAGADFPAAFARARAAGSFALIDLVISPEALSTTMTLAEARAAGLTGR